jgi:hypothetical protein
MRLATTATTPITSSTNTLLASAAVMSASVGTLLVPHGFVPIFVGTNATTNAKKPREVQQHVLRGRGPAVDDVACLPHFG